ncbi:unannotated protein [freshwater metagenome]|uniref:Unannotated protein n=1 Tax=freshwater metagenome TaxID=449393 RepID=A0A6J6JAN7_9ZZZZ
MTIRLSIMSLAGIVRTLVAVGTVRLASMFAARALGIPFKVVTVFSSVKSDGREVPGASAGIGVSLGIAEVVRDAGCSAVIGPVTFGSNVADAAAATGATTTSAPPASFCA